MKVLIALCRVFCTAKEIGNVLGLCEQAVYNRSPGWCEELGIEGSTFDDLRSRYGDEMKVSLRRAQWKAALDGSIPMLIFMGKQHLGQFNDYERDSRSTWEEDQNGNVLTQAQLVALLRAAKESEA